MKYVLEFTFGNDLTKFYILVSDGSGEIVAAMLIIKHK